MIVAGIGSRKGVSAAEVIAAVERALETHGLTLAALSALATTEFKRPEAGILAVARELELPLMVVGNSPTQASQDPPITRSALSQALAGVPSVSETAALLAAGPDARLAGPRLVVGRVTCAIAFGGDDS